VTANSHVLRDLDLLIDASRVRGSLALQAGARTQIAAVLDINRLVLDEYLPEPLTGDLGATLSELAGERDVAGQLTVDSLGWGALRASGVRLDGEVTAGKLTLRELSVEDIEEASGRLVGNGELTTGAIDLALDAQIGRPARLLRLFGLEVPEVLSRFAPVSVNGTLRRAGDLLVAEAAAAAPGMALDLEAELPPSLAEAPQRLHLQLRAPAFDELLSQLGFADRSGPAYAGPVELTGQMERLPDDNHRFGGTARLGPSRVHAAATLERQTPRPRLIGSLSVERLEPELLGLAYDMGELMLGWPAGPPSRWPGAWPQQPLGTAPFRSVDLELALDWNAGQRHGTGKLALQDGQLELLGVDAPLAGGWLSGRVDLDASGAEPLLSTQSRLERASVGELLPLVGLREGIEGSMDLDLTAQTTGGSVAALVGGLTGEARLAVRDGILQGVRLVPTEDPLAPAETPFQAIAGWLAIDEGLIVGDGLSISTSAGSAGLGLRLDLPAWQLEASLERPLDDGPAIRLQGTPGQLTTAAGIEGDAP
jgi:hypothetical protein